MDTIALQVLGLVLAFGFQPLLVGAVSLTTSIAFWVSLAFAVLGIVGTLFFAYVPDDVKRPLLYTLTAATWLAVVCIDRFVDLNTYVAYNVFGLSSVFAAVAVIIVQRVQPLPTYILILVTSLILITNSLIGASYVTVFVCIFFFGALVYALAHLVENKITDARAYVVAYWVAVFILQQGSQYHVQNNWMYFSLALLVAWSGIEAFLTAIRRGDGEKTGNWILLGHLFTGFIEIVLLALFWARVGDIDMVGAFSVLFMSVFFVFSFLRNEQTLLHLCGAVVTMCTIGWIGVNSLGLSVTFPILNAALVVWSEVQNRGASWLTSVAAVAFSIMAGAVRPQGVGILAATYAVGVSTFTVLGLLEAIRAKNGKFVTIVSMALYGGCVTYALSFLGSLTIQATVVLLIFGIYGIMLLVYLVWSNRTLRRVTP